jgi:hypothetical protein
MDVCDAVPCDPEEFTLLLLLADEHRCGLEMLCCAGIDSHCLISVVRVWLGQIGPVEDGF